MEAASNSSIEGLNNYNSIFSLGGQEYLLNNSGTKRLVIGITSSGIPNLKVAFKLHDLQNNIHLEFSKKTWNKIIEKKNEINFCLTSNLCGEIYMSSQIQIYTLIMYNRCMVRFFDGIQTEIVLAPETFDRMLHLENEINNCHKELMKKISDVTNRIKLFIDITFFQLFKTNNIDSRHFYDWILQAMNRNNNFSELHNSIAVTWEQLGNWTSEQELTASTSGNQPQ